MSLPEPIDCVGNEPGPNLLITGGIHGDEPEGVTAVKRLIEEIQQRDLRGSVTLVPEANPPAIDCGMRTGPDGLDLARTFPGRRDGSLTERVADTLTNLIRQADYYIDLHSGGLAFQIEPLTGYMLVSNREVLQKQRRMARAFGLPLIWGTSDKLEGRSLSVARDAGIPAIYAEYLGGAVTSQSGVRAYVDGCLNVMGEFGMLKRVVPSSGGDTIVEDDSNYSGHLQCGHPSPSRGYFHASVSLGAFVAKGTPIGVVLPMVDDAGANEYPVVADRSGRVICLRTDSPVDEGEGLAVIIDGAQNEAR